MNNLDYESVTRLNSLTRDIIAKTCTIKDIRSMIRDLEQEGAAYRPEITVASRKIRVSPPEYCYVKALLEMSAVHLERYIDTLNREIYEITNKEGRTNDRDQPEPKTEVQ